MRFCLVKSWSWAKYRLAEIVLGWSDRHGFGGNESGVAPAHSGVLAASNSIVRPSATLRSHVACRSLEVNRLVNGNVNGGFRAAFTVSAAGTL
jgi:hypothetical protein